MKRILKSNMLVFMIFATLDAVLFLVICGIFGSITARNICISYLIIGSTFIGSSTSFELKQEWRSKPQHRGVQF